MLGAYSSTSLPPYIRHYICWSSMSQHICHKNISSSLYFGSLLINIIATTLYTSQHMLWSSMPPYICHIYSWLYFGSLLVNIVATLYMSQHVFIVVFREPTRQHRCHPIYVTTYVDHRCHPTYVTIYVHRCISGAYSSTLLPPYICHYVCWSSLPPYICHNTCWWIGLRNTSPERCVYRVLGSYGVATVSRIEKNIGLFCRISSLL